mmetsp:Transcript_58251/g.137324  ORF Transcript_58251/g.137324 Transcript_58251/m.137324 type:complete len:187 (+) Transcript_58251:11-571(+)
MAHWPTPQQPTAQSSPGFQVPAHSYQISSEAVQQFPNAGMQASQSFVVDAATSPAFARQPAEVPRGCDACTFCMDVCESKLCTPCNQKREKLAQHKGSRPYTMCEVRRHNKPGDMWITAHGYVYDPGSFLAKHPGGEQAIARKAGRDCSEDFDFHSKGGRKTWSQFRVGKLVHCGPDGAQGSCVVS